MDIEKEPTVENWLAFAAQGGTGSKNTRKSYLRQLRALCEELGKGPSELLEEAKQNQEAFEAKIAKWVSIENNHSKVDKFCKYMALRSYMRANGVRFIHKMRKPVSPKRDCVDKRDLKLFLDNCPVKIRAFFLVARDSGLAPVDILNLKYGHIGKEFEKGTLPIIIKLIREKSQIQFHTLLGRESIEALKVYLGSRKNLKDSDPLFASFNGQLSYMAIRDSYKRVVKKTGIDIKPYDMRRFFSTMLRSKVNELYVKYWQGHTLGVETNYFNPTVEDQRQKYEEGYSALAFSENGNARITEIEDKVKQLEEENNHLRGQLNEYSGDVKTRLESLEKQRDELMAFLKKKT